MTLPAPLLQHVCDLAITIDQPIEIGQTAQGWRRMIGITGGTVTGPLMQGRVLAGGADYQLILADGTQAHLDARYAIELSDGARVFVHNTALRVASAEDSARIRNGQPVDPARVYFRCQPRFEASAPAWRWLSEHQFVGSGVRLPDAVHLSFYKLV